MAEPQAHVVQDLRFEVQWPTQEQAWEEQQRISDFVQGVALQIVEQSFDESGIGHDEVLRLERLDIDLGVVDFERAESVWAERLRHALQRQLAELRGGRQALAAAAAVPSSDATAMHAADGAAAGTPPPQWRRREDDELQALLHFVQHGRWPWSQAGACDPQTLAVRVWRHSAPALVQGLRCLPDAQTAAARLARQWGPAWLGELESRLQAAAALVGTGGGAVGGAVDGEIGGEVDRGVRGAVKGSNGVTARLGAQARRGAGNTGQDATAAQALKRKKNERADKAAGDPRDAGHAVSPSRARAARAATRTQARTATRALPALPATRPDSAHPATPAASTEQRLLAALRPPTIDTLEPAEPWLASPQRARFVRLKALVMDDAPALAEAELDELLHLWHALRRDDEALLRDALGQWGRLARVRRRIAASWPLALLEQLPVLWLAVPEVGAWRAAHGLHAGEAAAPRRRWEAALRSLLWRGDAPPASALAGATPAKARVPGPALAPAALSPEAPTAPSPELDAPRQRARTLRLTQAGFEQQLRHWLPPAHAQALSALAFEPWPAVWVSDTAPVADAPQRVLWALRHAAACAAPGAGAAGLGFEGTPVLSVGPAAVVPAAPGAFSATSLVRHWWQSLALHQGRSPAALWWALREGSDEHAAAWRRWLPAAMPPTGVALQALCALADVGTAAPDDVLGLIERHWPALHDALEGETLGAADARAAAAHRASLAADLRPALLQARLRRRLAQHLPDSAWPTLLGVLAPPAQAAALDAAMREEAALQPMPQARLVVWRAQLLGGLAQGLELGALWQSVRRAVRQRYVGMEPQPVPAAALVSVPAAEGPSARSVPLAPSAPSVPSVPSGAATAGAPRTTVSTASTGAPRPAASPQSAPSGVDPRQARAWVAESLGQALASGSAASLRAAWQALRLLAPSQARLVLARLCEQATSRHALALQLDAAAWAQLLGLTLAPAQAAQVQELLSNLAAEVSGIAPAAATGADPGAATGRGFATAAPASSSADAAVALREPVLRVLAWHPRPSAAAVLEPLIDAVALQLALPVPVLAQRLWRRAGATAALLAPWAGAWGRVGLARPTAGDVADVASLGTAGARQHAREAPPAAGGDTLARVLHALRSDAPLPVSALLALVRRGTRWPGDAAPAPVPPHDAAAREALARALESPGAAQRLAQALWASDPAVPGIGERALLTLLQWLRPADAPALRAAWPRLWQGAATDDARAQGEAAAASASAASQAAARALLCELFEEDRPLDIVGLPQRLAQARHSATQRLALEATLRHVAPAIDVADGSEPLFVGNAGLVLAAPYLPHLFERLGLLRDKAFVDTAACERAVLLLQYAASGRAEAPEPLLLLNKLLCGMPLSAPVPRGIELRPAERELVDGMLAAMIEHWKALGHTSLAGLRQTFLMREGKLEHDDEAWQLQVQPQTFDMLLDRLPWGYATLKFSWMPEILHVHWR